MPITRVTQTHGLPTTDSLSANSVPASFRPWLTRLLAGEVELAALDAAAVPRLSERTPAESFAVARALACPDLFILDAGNRELRERLIADIVRLAAERGQSVLALSPDPAAADRIVETVASQGNVRILRALAEDENPHRPSPAVTRTTSTALGAGRAEQLRREAAHVVAMLEAKQSRSERTSTLRREFAGIERDRRAIAAQLEEFDAEVRAEAECSPAALLIRTNRDAALAPLASKRAILDAEQAEKQAALAALCQKRDDSGKKPGLFARLFGHAPSAQVGQSIAALEAELNELAGRAVELQAEYEGVARRFDEEIEAQIAGAVAARRSALEPRQRELDVEAARIERLLRELLPPRATLDDTVERGMAASECGAEQARELAVARKRLDELNQAGSDLAQRLLAETQIVIGTPASLETDPVFSALAAATPAFALLVLDHAEELGEPELVRLAARASRCVLAGDAALPPQQSPALNGNGPHSRRRHPAPLLARLGRCLDREPWAVEGDRLVFRLVHLRDHQRRALVREPVLDHTHVELRVSAAGGDPVLAEIAFPAATTVVEAKSFLIRQLGEVLLRPFGEAVWRRSDASVTVCWPAVELGNGESVELEPGVREHISGVGPAAFTESITFDRAAGWDEEKAEAWLNERLPGPSASRIAVFPRHAHPHPAAWPMSAVSAWH
jgi:hypothetical protein